MIAQNIKPDQAEALAAREAWTQKWKYATYRSKGAQPPTEQELSEMLEGFGNRLIGLAEPIWKLQRQGIESSKWFQALGGVNDGAESTQNRGATEEKVSDTVKGSE